jgi:tight adherence protein B
MDANPPTAALSALVMSVAAAAFGRMAARRRLEADRERILGAPASAAGGRGVLRSPHAAWGSPLAPAVVAVASAWVGWLLGGIPTAIAAGACAPLALHSLRRHRARPDRDAVDRRVQEFADGVASAIRGGQSIAQAVEFAAAEVRPPLSEAAREFLSDRAVGAPLQPALARFADQVDTDESRLLALVLGIHHRAGGDVAGALDEVVGTIRHRLGLRRELRALTAQGRISGVVLGVLPVGFFLIMALISRGQMQPILRSAVGAAMVSVGFLLDGLALLWIRRLLRIEA